LFATLDTTTRQLYLGEAGRSVSLSDTVGFIRNLPHGLIDAFEATLQEAVDADVLLHVVDASNPHYPEQMKEVARVLAEIGAEQVPQVLVFNKLDAIEIDRRPLHLQDIQELDGVPTHRIFVSARTGEGLDALRQHLARLATRPLAHDPQAQYFLPPAEDALSLGTMEP
jgi:GTP-binding protein HflX